MDKEKAMQMAAEYARKHGLQKAEEMLNEASILVFGIESINVCGKTLNYINTGETYEPTVCECEGKIFVSSWGDWLEEIESGYSAETGEIHCSYCGCWFSEDGDRMTGGRCEECGNIPSSPPSSVREKPRSSSGVFPLTTVLLS